MKHDILFSPFKLIKNHNILFGLVLIFFSFPLQAQNIVTLKPKKEKAAIYLKPDFDSKILYLLPKEKSVIGTKSTIEGLSGLGLFHKVRLNSSTYGYVLDTEVQVGSAVSSEKKNQNHSETKKKKYF